LLLSLQIVAKVESIVTTDCGYPGRHFILCNCAFRSL